MPRGSQAKLHEFLDAKYSVIDGQPTYGGLANSHHQHNLNSQRMLRPLSRAIESEREFASVPSKKRPSMHKSPIVETTPRHRSNN